MRVQSQCHGKNRLRLKQLLVRPDTGAAARQIVTDAFEDLHLPAYRPQEIRREQAAQRSTDY